jgi:hypothetical protein
VERLSQWRRRWRRRWGRRARRGKCSHPVGAVRGASGGPGAVGGTPRGVPGGGRDARGETRGETRWETLGEREATRGLYEEEQCDKATMLLCARPIRSAWSGTNTLTRQQASPCCLIPWLHPGSYLLPPHSFFIGSCRQGGGAGGGGVVVRGHARRHRGHRGSLKGGHLAIRQRRPGDKNHTPFI